jgi:two-component system, OmpR family, sensor kinase
MSLRTRLLLSYALVIFVCVALMGLALLFLLRDAPVQKRLVTARLTLEAATINRLLRTPLQNGATPDQLIRRLQNLSDRTESRLLLIDESSGQVLADTENGLVGQDLFQLGAPLRFNNTLTGEFSEGDTRWLYSTRQLLDRRNALEVVAALPYEAAPAFNDPIFRALLQPLLMALVLAFAVSIVLAILVTRSVVRPVQHVAQAAQQITAGDYDQSVPVEGAREFKELARDFNQMAQQVRGTQHAQRDFLANVSHELKTPLTSIQGFAQAIQDGAAGDSAAMRKSATIIYDEATRMNRMVGELLDLARIESGQIVMRREVVQLDQLLQNVIERLGLRAQAGGVAWQVGVAANLPTIVGDGDRLAQVFSNLIDNALQHTSSGGKVSVAARPTSESSTAKRNRPIGVEITVADNGSGIPPEELSRIFERFYQVDKSRVKSKTGGLGLGLTIVKEIITAHGGTIHAESIEGLGTKFVVWLPVERAKT